MCVCVCVTLTQCWRKFSCRHADRDTCCVLTRELFVIFGIKTGVCVCKIVSVCGDLCLCASRSGLPVPVPNPVLVL